jgi:hypothetical protein
MKLIAVLIALSLSLLACGPVIPMEENMDESTEAIRFKENAEGTWDSDCRSFTDATGKPVSLRKRFQFDGKSAKLIENVFANYTCLKPVKSSVSYSAKMVVVEAVSDSDVVVELTNANKQENHFIRERAHMVLRGNTGLRSTIVGRSYLHDGKEEWMEERDYEHDRDFTFTKAE